MHPFLGAGWLEIPLFLPSKLQDGLSYPPWNKADSSACCAVLCFACLNKNLSHATCFALAMASLGMLWTI
jgi:hypothetical protein